MCLSIYLYVFVCTCEYSVCTRVYPKVGLQCICVLRPVYCLQNL